MANGIFYKGLITWEWGRTDCEYAQVTTPVHCLI